MFNLLALILFVAFSLVSCFVETSGLVYFGLLAGAVILAMLGQNKKEYTLYKSFVVFTEGN